MVSISGTTEEPALVRLHLKLALAIKISGAKIT
jgi:hypothetical protein